MKIFLCKTFAVLRVPIIITQESVNMAAIILAIRCVIFALLSASKELDSILSFSRGVLCCRLLDVKHTSRLVQINWKTLRIVKAVYFCYINIISALLCRLSLAPSSQFQETLTLDLKTSLLFPICLVTNHSSWCWRISNCQFHINLILEN